MRKVTVAMIGVGSISGIYLQNITHTFKEIDLFNDDIIKRCEINKQLMQIIQSTKNKNNINSSNENDIILDCFCGSGTTCVACRETSRRFIGMEIDTEYHKIAVNRLNGITANGQMSLLFDKNRK